MTITRRTLVVGSLAGAGLAALPAFDRPAAAAALIDRNHLYTPEWEMRRITNPENPQFNGYGMHLHEPGPSMFRFRSDFYDRCGLWAKALDDICGQAQAPRVDWFGAKWTQRPYGANQDHPNAIAMDLSAVYFAGGEFVDMHISWRAAAGLHQQRRYTAVAAILRVYFPEVLTHNFAGHTDHIHLDINQPRPPGIATNSQADTLIVQLACNHLNGAGLTLDGRWGRLTEAAYQNLLQKFAMTGRVDPKRSYLEMAAFLQLIGRTGLANAAAGRFTFS